MKSNYKAIGEFIEKVDNKNKNLDTTTILGISKDKEFMPSVANLVGTDLTKYKIVLKNQFSCNTMHVGRDDLLPVGLYKKDELIAVSPSYFVFEVIKKDELLSDYLMLWFRRKEFDRPCTFHTDGSMRGSISWTDFCNIELPVPSIEKQQAIVNAYQVVTDRIALL